jgi:hypothetical protein
MSPAVSPRVVAAIFMIQKATVIFGSLFMDESWFGKRVPGARVWEYGGYSWRRNTPAS